MTEHRLTRTDPRDRRLRGWFEMSGCIVVRCCICLMDTWIENEYHLYFRDDDQSNTPPFDRIIQVDPTFKCSGCGWRAKLLLVV